MCSFIKILIFVSVKLPSLIAYLQNNRFTTSHISYIYFFEAYSWFIRSLILCRNWRFGRKESKALICTRIILYTFRTIQKWNYKVRSVMKLRVSFYELCRGMTHLACRFCNEESGVHVVDPLLDLRYRFKEKERLKSMLKARLV